MPTILLILVCSLSLLAAPARSDPPPDAGALGYVDTGHEHSGGAGASEEKIIESVQKRYNAKVVRVSETTFEGRPALKLRLLSAQRVWSMVVDAQSGRVLSGG
jgi:hypothetical protein